MFHQRCQVVKGLHSIISLTLLIKIVGTVLFLLSLLVFLGVFLKYLGDRDTLLNMIQDYQTRLNKSMLNDFQLGVAIYDKNQKLMGEFHQEANSFMSMRECRQLKWLNRATVFSEDKNFFEHTGVSYMDVLRALLKNIITLSIRQGGGSITQQLARNLFTEPNDFKPTRKLYETYAAYLLEDYLSKEEILCLYLNKIYMGEGQIGAKDASLFYFRKLPQNLTAAESAMIVGLFPAPSVYSPLNNIQKSLRKQEIVLDRLVEHEHLDEEEKNKAIRKFYLNYHISLSNDYAPSGTIGLYGVNRYFKKNLAPSVNEYVRLFLLDRFSLNVIGDGLRVHTTIDLPKQLQARYAVQAATKKLRGQLAGKISGSDSFKESLLNGLNGVFIAINSSSWDIQAMVSGFSYSEKGYLNRATQMFRQPGSTIKGLLYALAIENQLVDESMLIDEPINLNGYRPRNWYEGYKGSLSIQEAVAMSVNTIPVKLLSKMGVSAFKNKIVMSSGISTSNRKNNLPHNLTLALGSGELSPLELASIYTTILNLGVRKKTRIIKRIETLSGKVLYEDFNDENERVLSEDACIQVIGLLRSVIEHEKGTSHWISTQLKKNRFHFPVAAKTGTVQGYHENLRKYDQTGGVNDVWYVAIVPYEVDLVWFGHDRGFPFRGSGSYTGGEVWLNYASKALKENTPGEFPFSFPDQENEEEQDNEENVEDSSDLDRLNSEIYEHSSANSGPYSKEEKKEDGASPQTHESEHASEHAEEDESLAPSQAEIEEELLKE